MCNPRLQIFSSTAGGDAKLEPVICPTGKGRAKQGGRCFDVMHVLSCAQSCSYDMYLVSTLRSLRWDAAYYLGAAVPMNIGMPLAVVLIYIGEAGRLRRSSRIVS